MPSTASGAPLLKNSSAPKPSPSEALADAQEAYRFEPESVTKTVPKGLRIAGAYAWRILLCLALIAVVAWGASQLAIVVVPFLVAVLVTALLNPLVDWMQRHKIPRGLGTVLSILAVFGVVSLLVWVVVITVRSGYPMLQQKAIDFWNSAREWVETLPFTITQEDVIGGLQSFIESLRDDISSIASNAVAVGSSVAEIATGAVLALFCSIFMLIGGRDVWNWFVGLIPPRAREAADKSGRLSWNTLGSFVRVQAIVAAIDAVGIGLGMWIIGLVCQMMGITEGPMPFVIPTAILVFLGSFIPMIGAVVTGAIATIVVLIVAGFWPAVIMLGVVILVQQIESNVLQPFIMGSAVEVHPLAVVLAVTAGTVVAGLPGAIFAVPAIAFLNVFVKSLAMGTWREVPDYAAPDEVQEIADEHADDQPAK